MRSWSSDPFLFPWLALLLLTLPLDWLTAFFFAAAFHELCHLLVIQLLGGRVCGIKISPGGAVLQTGGLGWGGELLSALAGPMGSLALLSLFRWLPRTALCALVHGVYNLLPIFPLDGGRILRCAAQLVSRKRANIICIWTERIAVGGIFALAILASFFLRLGMLPLILASFLIIRALGRKISCKASLLGVQ